ncbi:MAG: universal stress protein [Solirubrobacteraceae bacterium]
MIVFLIVIALLISALAAVIYLYLRPSRRRRPSRVPASGTTRILFPFVAQALSPRALDAALRLARSEEATLVPVFLARVSLYLPLDTALPRQSRIAIPLQEAIEQRASKFGVPVDARIERGRTYRHALRQTIQHERFEQIVIAASARNQPGFDPGDVAWLIDEAPGEIVVLRPDPRRDLEEPALRREVEQATPRREMYQPALLREVDQAVAPPHDARPDASPLNLAARPS